MVSPQILANIASSTAHIWLVAAGFALIYRTTRFFNFTHAAVYTCGAYAAYSVTSALRGHAVFGYLLGIVSATVIGGFLELCIFRPLRTRGAQSVSLLLASLGCLVVLQNAVSMVFGDDVKVVGDGGRPDLGFVLGGAHVTSIQFILIGSALAASLMLAAFLLKTQLGMILRASANDPILAKCVGVNVNRAILASFLIGSTLAGIAGVLWAGNTALSPAMGFNALLLGVVAALVGGLRSVVGSFAGAILIGSVQQLAGWFIPGEWQNLIVFLVMILFLVFRPQGLFGQPFRQASV
jgi:branched-subunit amino acid ABC-type transport system permease component